MTKEEVDAVGQGRVWMGQQALEQQLVDKMGGLREALEAARALAGLPTTRRSSSTRHGAHACSRSRSA